VFYYDKPYLHADLGNSDSDLDSDDDSNYESRMSNTSKIFQPINIKFIQLLLFYYTSTILILYIFVHPMDQVDIQILASQNVFVNTVVH
jgi:hypothetical protein